MFPCDCIKNNETGIMLTSMYLQQSLAPVYHYCCVLKSSSQKYNAVKPPKKLLLMIFKVNIMSSLGCLQHLHTILSVHSKSAPIFPMMEHE